MTIRTIASAALSVSLLLPSIASATGIQVMIDGKTVVFDDVSQSAWFASSVQLAAEQGIVSGYRDTKGDPTGRFGPSNTITVAEALKIASEGAGYDESVYANAVSSGVNHWASSYVSVAKSEGFPVIGRGDNIDRPATRAEVAALLAASFRLKTDNVPATNRYTDVTPNTEFNSSIDVLTQGNVITGDTDTKGNLTGTFRPNDSINRAEVATMIMKARAAYGKPGEGKAPDIVDGSTQTEQNLVVYSDKGFTPRILKVKKGDSVKFRNDSTVKLWIKGDPLALISIPGFNALKGYMGGETYIYQFNQIGTWGFSNGLKTTDQGTIIVE